MSRLNNLYRKMIEFYRGDPARIQHFVKVHSFATKMVNCRSRKVRQKRRK